MQYVIFSLFLCIVVVRARNVTDDIMTERSFDVIRSTSETVTIQYNGSSDTRNINKDDVETPPTDSATASPPSFTTTDFLLCHRDRLRPAFNASRFSIRVLASKRGPLLDVCYTCSCKLSLRAPPGAIYRLLVRGNTSAYYGISCISISDSSGRFLLKKKRRTLMPLLERMTYTNDVTIHMELRLSPDMDMSIDVNAIPASLRPRLEVTYFSPSHGSVQLTTFDGESPLPSAVDSWAHVTGTPGHVTMMSFEHLNLSSCHRTLVSLYAVRDSHDSLGVTTVTIVGSETKTKGRPPGAHRVDTAPFLVPGLSGAPAAGRLLLKVCDTIRPSPDILNVSQFLVHFKSGINNYHDRSGFKLLFYTVPPAQAPVRLEEGRFNCSGRHVRLDKLRHVFSCDLDSQCVGQEDEKLCPYTTPQCGEGLITSGGRCYKAVRAGRMGSWREAMLLCERHQAALPVLPTSRQWTDFRRTVFTFSRDLNQFREVPVGLKTASPGLPVIGDTPRQNSVTLASVNASAWAGEPELEHAFIACPAHHVTHAFLACDVSSACWGRGEGEMQGAGAGCRAPLSPLPPLFPCRGGRQFVTYTLVCDHRPDCLDASDEDFCSFPAPCGALQACDFRQPSPHCGTLTHCLAKGRHATTRFPHLYSTETYAPAPATIHLDGLGGFRTVPMTAEADGRVLCPASHYLCPSSGYCLPVYTRCNDVYDCPGHEDEACCEGYACPGFYRCRGSRVCLHVLHVCDGVLQCSLGDDEAACGLTCPPGCLCRGASLFCTSRLPPNASQEIRSLDAAGSGLADRDLVSQRMLIHLGLARCGLPSFSPVRWPNLHSLDLSRNRLTAVAGDFLRSDYLPNLRRLSLAGNPLADPLSGIAQANLTSLQLLDLSQVAMETIDLRDKDLPASLVTLNLSGSGVVRIGKRGLGRLDSLKVLDLHGCPLTTFPPDLLRSLPSLRQVQSDVFRLCCPALLPPGFNVHNCRAPRHALSSCQDLLRSDGYRVVLAVLASLTLLGNLGGLGYRLVLDKAHAKLGFGVFVTHLSAADLLMGAYLAVVGVADLHYRGVFVWREREWREGWVCAGAGMTCLVSCEVSALLVCLITLDRFLALRFPFSRLRFGRGSAQGACLVTWAVGLSLGAVPLLPWTRHWGFYSRTGLCLPLPVSRPDSAAGLYSFAVLIALNLALCLFIGAGQLVVYQTIRSQSLAGPAPRQRSQDVQVVRRLLTVALSDFLCWFPVGLMGVLAWRGVPISAGVNVAVAIAVVPLNSAVNPFLYTANILLEKRRVARERRLLRLIHTRRQQP